MNNHVQSWLVRLVWAVRICATFGRQIRTPTIQGPQLSLRLIVTGRDERAAAVNGDDQALVP
jgi:hypothetical protein